LKFTKFAALEKCASQYIWGLQADFIGLAANLNVKSSVTNTIRTQYTVI